VSAVPAIAARGVCVRAGGAAILERVDLRVAAGEVVALVGPSGAGKSTLLGALSGDRTLVAGAVEIAGRDLRALRAADLAALRAVLPQRPQLAAGFTAREVVQLGAAALSPEAARGLLDEVGLGALADRRYPTLSGGEQQRVQLARVLAQLRAHRGSALILDEPTAALDPRAQRAVLDLARQAAAAGHAVIAALHDLTLAARWADRVAVLARGRVVACGPPAEALAPAALARAFGAEFEVLSGRGGAVIAPLDAPAASAPRPGPPAATRPPASGGP
jgi:iron complex transport system ATP-binding protein